MASSDIFLGLSYNFFSKILVLLFYLVRRGLFFYSWIFVFIILLQLLWVLLSCPSGHLFFEIFFPDFLFLMFFLCNFHKGQKMFFSFFILCFKLAGWFFGQAAMITKMQLTNDREYKRVTQAVAIRGWGWVQLKSGQW